MPVRLEKDDEGTTPSYNSSSEFSDHHTSNSRGIGGVLFTIISMIFRIVLFRWLFKRIFKRR